MPWAGAALSPGWGWTEAFEPRLCAPWLGERSGAFGFPELPFPPLQDGVYRC